MSVYLRVWLPLDRMTSLFSIMEATWASLTLMYEQLEQPCFCQEQSDSVRVCVRVCGWGDEIIPCECVRTTCEGPLFPGHEWTKYIRADVWCWPQVSVCLTCLSLCLSPWSLLLLAAVSSHLSQAHLRRTEISIRPLMTFCFAPGPGEPRNVLSGYHSLL